MIEIVRAACCENSFAAAQTNLTVWGTGTIGSLTQSDLCSVQEKNFALLSFVGSLSRSRVPKVVVRTTLSLWERAGVRDEVSAVDPHPNPLPKGEGTFIGCNAVYFDFAIEVL